MRKRDAISPECDVTETNDASLLESPVKNTSPRARLLRSSCADLVSAVTPFQSWSSSVKPGSMGQSGKREVIYDLLRRWSQVWIVIFSRKSSLMEGVNGALCIGKDRLVKVRLAVWRVRVSGLT